MRKIIACGVVFAFISLTAFAQEKAPAKDGKTIFKEAKCMSCHTVKSAKVESPKKDKATDLSSIGDNLKPADFTKYLKKESQINGKYHPFPFKGNSDDLTILSKWLAELKTPKSAK